MSADYESRDCRAADRRHRRNRHRQRIARDQNDVAEHDIAEGAISAHRSRLRCRFGDTPVGAGPTRAARPGGPRSNVRLPGDLADAAEAVARVRGDSVNHVIIDALAAEIERLRSDADFTARAKKLLERDREILDRLAK